METSNKRHKILIVGPHPPPPGGMANFIENLESSKIRNDFMIHGFDTDYPRVLKKFRPLTLLWLPIMYLNYIRTLSNFNPDLVHVHTPSFASFHKHCLFMTLARRKKKQVILHVHGGKFKDFYEGSSKTSQESIKKKLNESDLLIVLSEGWGEFFKTIYPESKIRVVENGVPLEKFVPSIISRKHGIPRFIFVGEVKKEKGIEELLKASANIVKKHSNFHLIIVGRGEIDKYKNESARLGIDKNVVFTGEKSGDDLIKHYAESDIFAFPSHSEGMPLVVLEAMAMKLAVISTSVGSIPEIVSSEGGILVPPKETKVLENAIASLIEKPDIVRAMGEFNRKTVENRYSFDRVANQICNVYDEILTIKPFG